ncbi:MAG: carbohydrate porin [Phycisphaerales bacterium]|nr:carbohydrate porin [Phycisphaerales bacterium]
MIHTFKYSLALSLIVLGLAGGITAQEQDPLPEDAPEPVDRREAIDIGSEPSSRMVQPNPYTDNPSLNATTTRTRQGSWPLGSDGLLGNPFGLRGALEKDGIFVNGGVITMLGWNTEGGLATDFYGGNLLSIGLTFQTDKLLGLDGGTLFTNYQQWTSFGGPFGNGQSFDATGASNTSLSQLPARLPLNQLSQLWYDQQLGSTGLSIRFGKQDANLLFSAIPGSAAFVNGAAGYATTLNPYFPSYPEQAVGLIASWELDDTIVGRFGWFDGSNGAFDSETGGFIYSSGSRGPGNFFDNDGHWFFITECTYQWMLGGQLSGSISATGWLQTGKTGTSGNAPDGVQDVPGWLLYGGQTIWAPSEEIAKQGGGVVVFGQLGWSDPDKNPVNWSANAGISATGVVPGRPADSLGLMGGYSSFSENPDIYLSPSTSDTNGSPGGGEGFLEAYYLYQATPWLQVQPGIEWYSTPSGGDPASLSNALVFYLRIASEF